jgi:phospholipase/carboxylesterase
VPVRMMHGSDDPVIPLTLAQHSAALLLAQGVAVEWSVYRMGHEVILPEIRDISEWLQRVVSR